MERVRKANIDSVQFLQGFHNLRDEGKITSDECKSLINLLTSKSSFGPGSIRRNEISYDDLCEGMKEIPTVIQSVYKQATIWEKSAPYIRLSMLINIEK